NQEVNHQNGDVNDGESGFFFQGRGRQHVRSPDTRTYFAAGDDKPSIPAGRYRGYRRIAAFHLVHDNPGIGYRMISQDIAPESGMIPFQLLLPEKITSVVPPEYQQVSLTGVNRR